MFYFILFQRFFYPGGNQVNKNAKGFSWAQNYWCNLLNENAINGQHNPAKPIAMVAMMILCLTLITFWYIFPTKVSFNKSMKLLIQISGGFAMVIGMFLFTGFHDYVINIGTCFGLVAIIGTFIGLYKMKLMKLFRMGLFSIILIVLNNLLYYKSELIFYLPFVQKLTFAYFLLWICLINMKLYNNKQH